jgi:hypothetical protein
MRGTACLIILCEGSDAIHLATTEAWIASSLAMTGNKKPAVIRDSGLIWARKVGWRPCGTRYVPDYRKKRLARVSRRFRR